MKEQLFFIPINSITKLRIIYARSIREDIINNRFLKIIQDSLYMIMILMILYMSKCCCFFSEQ